MRKSILTVVLFVICPFLAAQQALNNDGVIKLVKAGLSEDLIVSTINATPGTYDASADGLIALKSAGVTDKVVAAIVQKTSGGAAITAKTDAPVASGSTADTPQADPDDPMTAHDPGIYLMTTSHEGKRKMLLIERAGAGREKTANTWGHAFSYGIAKAKIKAEIPGPRAVVRSMDAKPEFYMYFPPTGNLGAADTITSPSQFSLLRLEDKKDHRETTVEKIGFGSASAGNDEKKTFKFDADKIRPYSYKVTPDASLKAGEYAFLAATGMGGSASAGAVVVFDFGIDLK